MSNRRWSSWLSRKLHTIRLRRQLSLERLEDRTLPSSVSWSNPGSGNWDVPGNWSTGRVPGSGDDVIIGTTAPATIVIQSGDGESVHSLMTASNDTLSIAGGALTLAANSALGGPLSMSGGSLTATGAGSVVTASGATTVANASLFANGGATLSLQELTSYTGNPVGDNTTLQASGTGSDLDMSHLITLTGTTYLDGGDTLVNAQNGGTVNLSALTTDGGGIVDLQATGGGTLLAPRLTSLNSGALTVDATSTLQVTDLTSLTYGTITVNGGTPSLANLTDIDASSLYVTAGTLALPGATSYTGKPNGVNTTLQASGTGSDLDLSHLITFTGTTYLDGGDTSIEAQNGGTIDLASMTTDGGGIIDMEATGGGTLVAPHLTSLNAGALTVDANSTLQLNDLASLTGGTITVNGGTPSLPALADIDASNVYVYGGTVALPAATSYAGNQDGYNTTLEASGAGSQLNLPNLVVFAGGRSVDGGGITSLIAQQGGVVNLPGLTTYGGGIVNFQVGDGGSADFGGAVVSMPTAGGSTTIAVPPLPAALQAIPINLDNGGTLAGGRIYNIGAGDTVYLTGTYSGGTTLNVPQGTTVDLTGGQTVTYSGTLTASGAGTVQFASGQIDIGLGGLTLNFPGSTFQWTGGIFSSSLGNLTNLGTINLAGSNEKNFWRDGTLDNFGTMIQTGSGNLGLHSDNVTATTLKIEPGASYLLESNSGIDNPAVGATAIVNDGEILKTAGGGTSTLLVNGSISNTGTIESDSGTLYLDANSIAQVSNTTLTAGTWNAQDGAILQFPTGTTIAANAGTLALAGHGATIAAIAGLTANSGSLALNSGATFTTAGSLTNSGTMTVGPGSTLTVAGNFTETSGAAFADQLGGAPTGGQFGQVVVHGTATLTGALDVALVNGFGPSAGQDFTAMTFASASGTFTTFAGLSPFFTESQSAASLDLVDSGTSAADLVTTGVTAPVTAAAGQPITVAWQVSNPGSQALTGSWQDSVYVSATPSITGSSILLGSAPRGGGLGGNSSYSASLTAALPALAPGNYYVLVQADSLYQVPDPNRANNTLAASTGQLTVTLPTLTPGTPLSDSFTAADQDRYYQVTVPAGGTLTVTLSSAAASGAVALYVGQGTLPTPFSYQEAAVVAGQPSQTVTIPRVLTGATYYILAHSVAGNAATAGYTLSVNQSGALSVSAISSYAGGNAGNVTVEIDGANFTPDATATLTLGGRTFTANAIDYVNASQLFATFNLTGATAGSYTVQVQQGAQSATAPSTFQVVAAAGSPALSVQLSLPQFIRAGRTGTVVIGYTNTTANDLVAPLLDISSTNAEVFFSTPDDPNNFVQSAQVLAVAPNGPAGILRPGQSGELTLTLLSNDTINNDQIPVQVSQITAGQTIDWAAQQTSLQPRTITTAAWNVIFGNLIAEVGSTTDSYNAALAQASTYLSSLGETTPEVSSVARLWSFLVSQANASFPTATLTSAVDASLSTPGSLSLSIDRTFLSSLAGRYQPGIFGLGWATSWQSSLSADSAGNVTVDSGGTVGYFVLQANGNYLDTDGEYGTLTRVGSVFTFTSTTGTQYVFLANGLLNFVQDTNGNRITLGYEQNQLVTLTYANPADASGPIEQLTLTYNAQGLVSQVADGTGDTWAYAYDSAGHLLTVTAPGNLVTSYTYDTGSNPETTNALLSITNPDGSQQLFTYDGEGRLGGISKNSGADPITIAYPGEAEITSTDAANQQTTVWFTDLGMARVEDPLGGITNGLYDSNGNLISYTDAAGNTYQGTYDASGNLTQIVNPLGQTLQMTYGPLSNLTSITDADGNTTQYAYNSQGNLLSITYPGGSQQSFSYDPLGNLSDTILQNGDPVNYQHNAQGLVTSESFADGTSQNYTYDAHGNLLTAETYSASNILTGTTTLTYNAANELTSITYPNGQYLKFTYNTTTGQRTQSVDQSGFAVNYVYDVLGRLSELQDGSGNLIVQYTYNNLGQLQEKQNGNGTYTTYAYDAAGNLTSEINYASGATVNSSFTYTYNLLGEQTSVTDGSGNVTTYGYDATGQLTQVTLPGGVSITYVYNAAGDRTEVINNGTTTNYQSNADNEITQVGSATYTYDANGNLRTVTDSSGTTTYTYNDLNQLVSIAASDGTATTFQYSPLGYLVGTSVNGTQTNYLVDPTGLGNVVGSSTGSGSLITHYNFGLGLVSQTGSSGTGYYDFDSSSNTVGITGASGSYVNQYSYLPFGDTTTISATLPNPFTFVGQFGVFQIDNTLFSMRARDYTPATGQFFSNDPTGLAGRDSNLRRYVKNQPTISIDPCGLAYVLVGPNGGLTSGPGPVNAVGGLQTGYNIETGEKFSVTTGGFGAEGVSFFTLSTGALSAGDSAAFSLAVPVGPLSSVGVSISPNSFDVNLNLGIFPSGFAVTGSHTVSLTAHDPNTLIGPAGFGTQNFIQPTAALPYTIDFENDGSIAAQDVTVTEQLDPNLDWSTFQLGSFGFGPINFTIPAGLTQYQTTVSYRNTDGSALNVLITLDFNVGTGLLTVTFASLDPLSGQAPTGVFDGFLPPDNASGIGEGFVQYTVRPKASLTTGATINQQASVVFDTNAPVETATVTNTIDAGPPTSTVAALPATEASTSFLVSWSGTDDAGGSGIASYAIFVSDDGGPFTPWLIGTTATSGTYSGQNGHTYGFCCVATDNVGNVQPTPTAAQATTSVAPGSAVARLTLSGPTGATIGAPILVTVTALDASGNVATRYRGTVDFTNSEPQAGLPASYAFQASDAGTHTFAVTMATAGPQTLTAADANNGGLTASTLIYAANGGPPSAQLALVASDITHSYQAYYTFVAGVYRQFLGRSASLVEINSWVTAMQNGMTDQWVEAWFLASTEYIQANGGTGAGWASIWVASLYENVLKRPPSALEVSQWVQDLDGGLSTGAVAYGFTSSVERASDLVTGYYANYLGRAASQAEVNGWVNDIEMGLSLEAAIASFVGSPEFYAKNGGGPSTWLDEAYVDLFDGHADLLAFDAWMPVLES